MMSATAQPELDRLAGLIHDGILQSLGVCVLEMELSRRFAGTGQRAEAAAEMDGALAALQEAIEQSRGALVGLRGVARWLEAVKAAPVAIPVLASRPSATSRPSLRGVAGHPTPDIVPDELVRVLGGCLSHAELCRAFHRVGNDDVAFDAIGDLLDRLDDVAGAFRQLMSALRRAGAACSA